MSHFKRICRSCGVIMEQCRCPNANKTILHGTCAECRAKELQVVATEPPKEDPVEAAPPVPGTEDVFRRAEVESLDRFRVLLSGLFNVQATDVALCKFVEKQLTEERAAAKRSADRVEELLDKTEDNGSYAGALFALRQGLFRTLRLKTDTPDSALVMSVKDLQDFKDATCNLLCIPQSELQSRILIDMQARQRAWAGMQKVTETSQVELQKVQEELAALRKAMAPIQRQLETAEEALKSETADRLAECKRARLLHDVFCRIFKFRSSLTDGDLFVGAEERVLQWEATTLERQSLKEELLLKNHLLESLQQPQYAAAPVIERPIPFIEALTQLLNRYSRENASNTPDFILSEYLQATLAAFNAATQRRDQWYDVELRPGLVRVGSVKAAALPDETPPTPPGIPSMPTPAEPAPPRLPLTEEALARVREDIRAKHEPVWPDCSKPYG